MENKLCGIYKINCKINNVCYVGQSVNIHRRLMVHKRLLEQKKHENIYLQNLYNKYGKENLEYSILELCSIEELDDKERYWISFYGGVNSKLNCNWESGGHSHKTYSNERKRLMSEALKGKRISPKTEFKKGNIVWNKGKTLNQEIRKKLSMAHMGNKQSEESKRKISEKMKKIKTSDTCYNSKRVLKIDINGNIVKEYSSMCEASRDVGIASINIRKRTRHSDRLYDNHYWKLKGETL